MFCTALLNFAKWRHVSSTGRDLVYSEVVCSGHFHNRPSRLRITDCPALSNRIVFKQDLWQAKPYKLLLYQVTNPVSPLSSLRLHILVVFFLKNRNWTINVWLKHEKLLINHTNLEDSGVHLIAWSTRIYTLKTVIPALVLFVMFWRTHG